MFGLNFPGENLMLSNFSSHRGVAILGLAVNPTAKQTQLPHHANDKSVCLSNNNHQVKISQLVIAMFVIFLGLIQIPTFLMIDEN